MFWALIVHLGLGYVLPLFDSHAVEYEPLHTHVFLGAPNADWAIILAEHQNGYYQAVHPYGLPAQPDLPASIIISTHSLLNGFLVANGQGAEIFASLDWLVTRLDYSLWLTGGLAAFCLIAFASPPPLHPPRPA